MAYLYEAWEADGKGQDRFDHFRSDSVVNEIKTFVFETWKRDKRTVLVTRRRTEKSDSEKVIYTRPGYTDPCY